MFTSSNSKGQQLEGKDDIEFFTLTTKLRTVNVPIPRIHHATTCHQNTMYCLSGLRGPPQSAMPGFCINDCHQLNFRKTFPWKLMERNKEQGVPSERFSHVMWSRTKTKSLWITGGLNSDLEPLKDIWCIENSTKGHWRQVSSNVPISIFASSVLYHKSLDTTLFYGIHGLSQLRFDSPPEGENVNGVSESSLQWIRLDPIPGDFAYRTGHIAEWMQKNQMIIFGGESFISPPSSDGVTQEPPQYYLDAITESTGWMADVGPESFLDERHRYDLSKRVTLNDMWMYNISTEKWELLHPGTSNEGSNSRIPTPRAHHSSCVVKRNMYIYGGVTIKNGVVSAVEDMDVVYCIDLYQLSKSRESGGTSLYNLWRRIDIRGDYLPRDVVGFSLNLIARKDKAVAFIGFGGYDLKKRKAVNRMFTLIDSRHDGDMFKQARKSRTNDQTSVTSQDDYLEHQQQSDSPVDDIDDSRFTYSSASPSLLHSDGFENSDSRSPNSLPQINDAISTPSHCDNSTTFSQGGLLPLRSNTDYSNPLQTNPNSPFHHDNYNIQSSSTNLSSLRYNSTAEERSSSVFGGSLKTEENEAHFPMRSDPLPSGESSVQYDHISDYNPNQSYSYSLFSNDSSLFTSRLRTPDENEDERISFLIPSTFHSSINNNENSVEEYRIMVSNQALEIAQLQEKLNQVSHMHNKMIQQMQLDYQMSIRKMQYKYHEEEVQKMDQMELFQARAELEKNLATVNDAIFQSTVCVMCSSSRKSIFLTPCSHVSVCEHCANGLLSCPTCDFPIEGKYRIRF